MKEPSNPDNPIVFLDIKMGLENGKLIDYSANIMFPFQF